VEILVPVTGQVIAREVENLRRLSTGKDLVLVATRRRDDIEAAIVATDDTVCVGEHCGIL